MAKPLSILFVSSEVYPFAKESGIGDVAFSLPLALRDIGHDIRVMLPKYGTISERKNKIHEINRLRDMPIPMGDTEELATVKSSSINNPRVKVQAYITTNFNYFDSKKGVYHDPVTWEEYPDNAERFIFFCRSVVETCMLLGWYPDVIHCNGWQTALIPAYVHELFPKKFKKTRTVFTIHNLSTQGESPLSVFEKTGLPEELRDSFTHKGQFNFMKGGILHANHVTTVSESYAEQSKSDAVVTNGLNEFVKAREESFTGILNGIDFWSWNPEKDKNIPKKYEGDFEEYKYDNKVVLTQKFDLEFKPKVPIVGMVTRLDDQKGIPLLLEAIEEILELNLQMVILGKGDADLKEQIEKVAEKYPEKLKFKDAFDDHLAHLVEAGSDVFLMPSKNEPCGLNLMYSLVYGSVPIIHATGGLKEIASSIDEDKEFGNTVMFHDFTKEALLEAVKKTIELFKDAETWEEIARNGMNGDYSWETSAAKYEEIYREILKV